MKLSAPAILHEVDNSRFVMYFEGESKEAETLYVQADEQTLNFVHTFVPKAHEGQGIARKLLLTALAYAEKHGMKIIPTCPVWRIFMLRHPEFAHLQK